MGFILILFGNNLIQFGNYYYRKSNLCLLKTLREKTIFIDENAIQKILVYHNFHRIPRNFKAFQRHF
jgi:hypothetical protein